MLAKHAKPTKKQTIRISFPGLQNLLDHSHVMQQVIINPNPQGDDEIAQPNNS